MKDLLTLLDLSAEQILEILDLADKLKECKYDGISHQKLKNKTLAMIFEKSSTRTRVSFEVGMFELGGQAIFLSSNDIQLGRGESVKDTARVLDRYVDGIMIRTYKQSDVEELAAYSRVPVINGLTDEFHPCQVLADLMTIREYFKTFKGLNACFIGDSYNMANSLIVGCLKMGMNFTLITPDASTLSPRVLEFVKGHPNFKITDNVLEGAKGAHVLFTDVWASMGHEKEVSSRKEKFKDFAITDEVMAVAAENAIIQHCLPAHKGEEISEEIFEAHAKEIFDEAENRLHAQKAVMVMLMSGGMKK